MAFSAKGAQSEKTYYLHEWLQEVKGGQQVRLYYFSAEAGEGAMDIVPDGYEVVPAPHADAPRLQCKRR